MTNTLNFARKALRGSTALQALALLGAGVGMSAVATPASAQDYSQVTASGRVQGTDGKAIQGATVTVTSNGQGFTRTVTTSSDGQFQVPALPQGSYTFTIEANGYDSFSDNAVTLTQGASSNQFMLAAAGATGGDIVVTAGRVQTVDFNQNTTGAVINVGELATRVPVGRDINSIIQLAPGTTTGDTAFGAGANALPSIGGSSVSENVYYINGLNITNFRNGLGGVAVPFDFYQTVDIKNGGYSAEFGRATGGFINATTKSGSNEFHGGITFNWEPNDLRDKSPNTYATDNDSRYSERKDFIAQLSGPIIKDHLFFYGLYQARNVQSAVGTTSAVSAISPFLNVSSPTGAPLGTPPNATVQAYSCFVNPAFCVIPAPGFPSNLPATPSGTNRVQQFALAGTGYQRSVSTSPFYGGKIDAVIVDGQRLEFTYFNTTSDTFTSYSGTNFYTLAGGRYNPNTNNPGLALPAAQGGTLRERSGGENYVGRYTGQFTDWLTLSAAYGRNYNTTRSESSGIAFPAISDTRAGVTIPLGNPNTVNSYTNDRRDFYRADADVYVNLLGSHHFRGGYDREDLTGTSYSNYNGTYAFTYYPATTFGTPTPIVARRYFRNGNSVPFKARSTAYYLEDNWKLFDNRLNLNLGVRNDAFVNRNERGQKFFNSKNNWGPRLGFSFDPTGDARSKVYGSFSRYFTGVPVNTNTRHAGPELDYTQYYALAGVNADQTPIYGAAYNNDEDFIGTGPCPTLAVDLVTGGGNANCSVNQNGQAKPFNTLVATNLQAQKVDEWILGGETRFGRYWKVGAYYTQRDLKKSLEDGYIDKAVVAYCTRNNIALTNAAGNGCAQIFTGDRQYTLFNPGYDVTVALNAERDGLPTNTALNGKVVTLNAADFQLPKARRDYKSMTLTVDREFDGKWSFSGSYTISALVGNIEGGIRSDNGQTDANLTTAFDFPALMDGSYGYLPNHARHNIKLYGSYQVFNFLNLGANLQITSPRKFGCIGTVPNYRDPLAKLDYGASGWYCNVNSAGQIQVLNNAGGFVSSDSPPSGANQTNASLSTLRLIGRGRAFQSDWLYNLNIDAALKIPTDAFDGTIRFSVFNVLNRQAKLDFQEVGTSGGGAPSATYRQPLTYQTPRFVRIQFGVNF